MSYYVFRDSARTITVQRTDAYKERKDQRFYCPKAGRQTEKWLHDSWLKNRI